MRSDPLGKLRFRYSAFGNAQHCRNAFSIVCKEAKTIQNDKQLHYNETRSLVTIHERMIAN